MLVVDSMMSLQAIFHSYFPLVILCSYSGWLIIIIIIIFIFLSVKAMGTVVESSTSQSYTVETIPGEK